MRLRVSILAFALTAVANAQPLGVEAGLPARLSSAAPPIERILPHGRAVFSTTLTEHDGGGRPFTKGTGRPLSDPSNPISDERAFNRISAPDANSCAGCHNLPYGITGGGGDFVTNVFVLGQRFDFVTFDPNDKMPTRGNVDESGKPASVQTIANMRSTTGLFGAGYLEMLARQITQDLQLIRDSLKIGQTKELKSKGISYGKLTRTKAGLWDTSKVEGLSRLSLLSTDSTNPPSLVIRPWHQAGHAVSIREFTNTAFNHHHGMQSTERFGLDTDPDGDGVTNELTVGDITAVSLWQATLQVPGRVISRHPVIEQAVLNGERVFERIGCGTCHIPKLALDKQGWIYSEPNPFNPPGNLRKGEAPDVTVDLNSDELPAPRLKPDANGIVWVDAFTDFKLHDIGGAEDVEPLDMNHSPWNPKFREGNRRFLTKRLWGAANEPPFFHHGLFTTMRRSILAHAGEALESRKAFEALSDYDRNSLIEFLKTLQVLPPGTKHRIVDENFKPREWPPNLPMSQR
ncbi:MAG: thiol oxidoreductase [Acidobacteria bacterium]|nr:thiol oxidoreductase [Acidobacteriota bacterium]